MGLTKAEVVEKIHAHFSAPGAHFGMEEQGEFGANTCVYRGNNDAHSSTRCAFGVFIPDDVYDYRMENKFSREVIEDWNLEYLFDGYDEDFSLFLMWCQQAHDNCARYGKTLDEFLSVVDELATISDNQVASHLLEELVYE